PRSRGPPRVVGLLARRECDLAVLHAGAEFALDGTMTKVAFIAPLAALILSAAMGGCLEGENEFEDQHTRFAGTWELQATPDPGGLACDVFDGEVTSWALAASDGHFGRSVELAVGSSILEIKSADETADRLHVQFRKHELWLEQRGGSAEGDYDF